MKSETASVRRKELGAFLQVVRGRSAPADFGFPAGSRRRTAGLRREEMAQLVGISPTWYTWIEQGREVNVSEVGGVFREGDDKRSGIVQRSRSGSNYDGRRGVEGFLALHAATVSGVEANNRSISSSWASTRCPSSELIRWR